MESPADLRSGDLLALGPLAIKPIPRSAATAARLILAFTVLTILVDYVRDDSAASAVP
jgi:hypothetical protein